MTDIYNYNKNITITTTPNGDKVITMNKAILTKLCNCLYDAQRYQQDNNLNATAKDTAKLWEALAYEDENE